MGAGSAIGHRRGAVVIVLVASIVVALPACSSSTPSESPPASPTTEHDMTKMGPGNTMAGGY